MIIVTTETSKTAGERQGDAKPPAQKSLLETNSEQTEGSCCLTCQQRLDVRLSTQLRFQNTLDVRPSLQGPALEESPLGQHL